MDFIVFIHWQSSYTFGQQIFQIFFQGHILQKLRSVTHWKKERNKESQKTKQVQVSQSFKVCSHAKKS